MSGSGDHLNCISIINDSPAENVDQCESNPNSQLTDDDKKMEDLVLKNCETMFKAAFLKLTQLGYEQDVALHAILKNGRTCGGSNAVANIVQNAIDNIRTGKVLDAPPEVAGGDMTSMIDYSLIRILDLHLQPEPNLTKWQVMQRIFLTDSVLPAASNKNFPSDSNENGNKREHSSGDNGKSLSAKDCDGDHKVYSEPQTKFSLIPPLALPSMENVPATRASVEESSQPPQTGNKLQSTKDSLVGLECEDCTVDELLNILCNGNQERLERKYLDPKVRKIFGLVRQIMEAEGDLKERQEWAQRKVLQAAAKLHNQRVELRKRRVETMRMREAEEARLKKKSEKKSALRKVGALADLNLASLVSLEVKNADIKAKTEALKLDASESDRLCLESRKKEKKLRKKITSVEKQCYKVHEEITENKTQTSQLEQKLINFRKAQEDIEARWRQELQEKELSINQVQDELRLKKEVEIKISRRRKAMQQKMEVDCQHFKGIVRRLELEIHNLESEFSFPNHFPSIPSSESQLETSKRNLSATSLPHSSLSANISAKTYSRMCTVCGERESCTVFLPCAHQIMCASCNKDHSKTVGRRCPSCQALVPKSIQVYGMNS